MRRPKESSHKPDYVLLAVAGFLVLLGIIALTSVSTAFSLVQKGSTVFYLSWHISFGVLGGSILGLLAYKISLSRLKTKSPQLLFLNLFLMLLVFLPKIGVTSGGAKRWIDLGFATFQPSEFLKITTILYLAFWLSQRQTKLFSTFAAFFTILGIIGALLVLQRDISTLVVITICALAIYFLSGSSLKHILLLIPVGLAALAALIKFEAYRLERFLVFIKPDIDPLGLSYQLKQALIAIGSGGIFGRSPGMSLQKFSLPQPMSDSIFAVIAEEWGFLGSLFLIGLFLTFAWRGIVIVKKTQDKFYQLTALGITVWLTLQAFVNIGSMVGILPLTGIPLPFISYGGSALMAELAGLGILLNISKHA
ncbi:MAG: hypothetical protein A2896_01835 [Candidatus Nealsonbacteria bacterium RIFCSPLOWO2_01_FULL_43_32]|uniref:Probable peptidoglycan glycosyltransferase FtsW n=1 Tax=Candidatus Nealsonbacteria bacterium RIFCSPLOWO2_01_FULL_43_32 TaxID=1801672 RepID=A0A1G2EFT5_9BACT|nr:MAG: hypothetical protein A2896_01835 [Candidatus Nealsonbacteria bacterium RIFCSPLOWO2_01_FULL_43_32]